jgi:hypothetical protein
VDYSKPIFGAAPSIGEISRKFHDTPVKVLERATALTGQLESSDQRILRSRRTVALLSYHRPDAHSDARTSPPGK